MKNKILVIAAHPDDETIGCGGAIIKHIRNGDSVSVLTISDGETSRDVNDKKQRNSNFIKAMESLGVKNFDNLDYPDQRLDVVSLLDIIQNIEKKISEIQPNILYTHHYSDLNIDHQITHKAVMTAARPLPNSSIKEILCFEIVSSTEWSVDDVFMPNYFIDIESELDEKIKACNCYVDEMNIPPHARSIESIINLAKYRGAQVGIHAAEAFQAQRIIFK